MRIGSFRIDANWGHLAGVTAGAAFIVWYMLDTYRASSSIQNIGLIVPAGIGALGLYLFIVVQDVKIVRVNAAEAGPRPNGLMSISTENWRVPAFMVLLGLLLIGMAYIGFDIAAVLFIASGLYILNERRWLLLIIYSILFGLGVTYFFTSMLSLPISTLVI
jgi:putative tricarboxylic transport membrane protein